MAARTYSEHFDQVIDLINRPDLEHLVPGWTDLVETTLVHELRALNQNSKILSGLKLIIGQHTLALPVESALLDFIQIDVVDKPRRMDIVSLAQLHDTNVSSGNLPDKGTGSFTITNTGTAAGVIPADTAVIDSATGLKFYTTADSVSIASSGGTDTLVPCIAEQPGKAYELGLGGTLTLAPGFFPPRDTIMAFTFDTAVISLGGGGIPLAMAISGPREIRMSPAPNEAYLYTLFFREVAIPIDNATLSSVLLKEAPALMLYATAVHGALYAQDMEKLALFKGEARDAKAAYSAFLGRRKMGGGPLQIRPDIIPNDEHVLNRSGIQS